MKTLQNRTQEGRRLRFEANLQATLAALFRRHRTLYGFTVLRASELSSERIVGRLREDLYLADLVAHQWPGATDELCDDVGNALLGLMDDGVEAGELLAGRTFARAVS
jgi:hypothetical protein